MTHDFYLQGSYRNDTNLTGDSDVDVVFELNSTRYLGGYPGLSIFREAATYSWDDFRRETLKALELGFGKKAVAQHNKSIRIQSSTQRLAADVVVCATFRHHRDFSTYVDGITLFALQEGRRQIVNYPKKHFENGANKSRATGDRYKRTVRMFKNARNHLETQGRIKSGLAPSYFIECLLYNAPNWAFQSGFQETYSAVVNGMLKEKLEVSISLQ